jgi:Putative Flp pilus-assembly TadE/G-like
LKRPVQNGWERGQAIILAIVALNLFLMGALGLGIDGAEIFAHRQMAQAAADAAAQAAIMSIKNGTNSTSAHPFSTAASFTCTVPPAALDLRTPCVYAQYNGFGTSTDSVIVSFPATLVGVSLAAVTTPAVTVIVQRVLKTSFLRFLGVTSSTIKARASAGLESTVPPTCLYVLDPAASNAFSASNGATVNMNCGVYVDSSSGTAASVVGGAVVTASAASVVGGSSVNNGGSITPAFTTGTPVTSDPFASLPTPAVGACTQTNYNPGFGSWTLNPGVYCGGIVISNGATAVFNPGTYIIKGGGMTFGGGTTSTGSGVMFYLTGTNATYASVNIANGVNVTFSAETSGSYLGVLFYQDRSITSASNAVFAGGSTSSLTGSLYFPTTGVNFSNGASGSGNTAIVADQVSFTGGANLKYDSTGLKTGLSSQTASLVE